MVYTVYNDVEAPYSDTSFTPPWRPQAGLDARDLDVLVAGFAPTAVISGCAVAAQGTPDMTVAVAAGVVRIGGRRVAVAGGNVTITTAAASPRWDLITVDTSGTKAAVAGTAVAVSGTAEPAMPAIPTSRVVLAAVLVPGSATSITNTLITDKRIILTDPLFENVQWYGALPDGADSTAAQQAAIDASQPGATIYWPQCSGSTNYGITAPLVFKGSRKYLGGGHGYSGNGAVIRVLNGSNIANSVNAANPVAMFVPEKWNTNTTTSDDPVIFESLHLYGNRANNTGNCSGIILMNFWSQIKSCFVEEMNGDGIHLTDRTKNETAMPSSTASENRIFDSKVQNVNGIGIKNRSANLLANLDGFLINCYVAGTGSHGIDFEVCAGWQIQNNHLNAIGADAIRATRAYATSVHYNYIEDFGGNNAVGVTYCGVTMDLQTGRGSTIQGNKIFGVEPNVNASSYRYINVNTASNAETECHVCVNHNEIRGNNRATGTGVYVSISGGTSQIVSALLEPNDIHNIGGPQLNIASTAVIPYLSKPSRMVATANGATVTTTTGWASPAGWTAQTVRQGISYRCFVSGIYQSAGTAAGIAVRVRSSAAVSKVLMFGQNQFGATAQEGKTFRQYASGVMTATITFTGAAAAATDNGFLVDFTFTADATGTITVDYATELAATGVTLQQGSYIVLEELLT